MNVKLFADNRLICTAPISETVQSGAYNSMNWHAYSERIAAELRQQHNVRFEIDSRFGLFNFNWREWLYVNVEQVHFYVMMVVRHCFSHNAYDMPAEVIAPLIR